MLGDDARSSSAGLYGNAWTRMNHLQHVVPGLTLESNTNVMVQIKPWLTYPNVKHNLTYSIIKHHINGMIVFETVFYSDMILISNIKRTRRVLPDESSSIRHHFLSNAKYQWTLPRGLRVNDLRQFDVIIFLFFTNFTIDSSAQT